jgi:predicted N-formylglutamate amidohydrolase
MPDAPAILITCEHGGNAVPPRYRALFAKRRAELDSHAGYDPGALALAWTLSRACGAPLIASDITRLLVDLNRSPGHRGLFSATTRSLPPDERRRILADHYLPHREAVARAVAVNRSEGKTTLHVAAHTFTPVLRGSVRAVEAGLLYDPARAAEAALCARWQIALRALAPDIAVRRNAPYRGASDGLATWLRRAHPESAYLGVEVELNQKFLERAPAWEQLCARLAQSLQSTIEAHWDSLSGHGRSGRDLPTGRE